MDNLLFVTSFFPYANREAWVEDELISINSQGHKVYVAPRSFGLGVVSSSSFSIINVPIFCFSIFIIFFKKFSFTKYFNIFCLSCSQANTFIDFVKRTSVLPKAIYIAHILKDCNIKHVHVYTTTSAATMGSAIAVLLDVDWSFTVHTSSQLTNIYKKTYVSLYRSANFIRCISNKTRGDLIKFFGVDSSKIIVSRLGVIPTKKNEHHVKNSQKFFIVATQEKYKGIEFALHAFHDLNKKGLFTSCYIVGDGSLRMQLQELCKILCIDESTYFVGQIPHTKLTNLLEVNRGAALVLTSDDSYGQEEGIPVVVMEAMNYGLFVIATRNGGIDEIVINDFNGYLVEQRSTSQISNACEKYLRMSDYSLDEFIKNARKTIESNYDIRKNANKFLKEIL